MPDKEVDIQRLKEAEQLLERIEQRYGRIVKASREFTEVLRQANDETRKMFGRMEIGLSPIEEKPEDAEPERDVSVEPPEPKERPTVEKRIEDEKPDTKEEASPDLMDKLLAVAERIQVSVDQAVRRLEAVEDAINNWSVLE